jgi:hypothetical protein
VSRAAPPQVLARGEVGSDTSDPTSPLRLQRARRLRLPDSTAAAATTVVLARNADASEGREGEVEAGAGCDGSPLPPFADSVRPMWVVELERKLVTKEEETQQLRKSLGRLEAESKLLKEKIRGWRG